MAQGADRLVRSKRTAGVERRKSETPSAVWDMSPFVDTFMPDIDTCFAHSKNSPNFAYGN